MRFVSAIFAGVLATTAFGGAIAHAQESSSDIWVNSHWNTPRNATLRAEAAMARSLSRAQLPTEEVALGFTLTSYTGIVGQLELGRVSLGGGSGLDDLLNFVYPGVEANPVDQAVGQADINWNLTPRVALSTSFSRDVADAISTDGVPVFEDTVGGGVSYAITPRFAVSAGGAMTVPTDENSFGGPNFSSGEAEFGAAYSFMPFFTGSVNYTYRSFDGQEGELRPDESTVLLSLTGTF